MVNEVSASALVCLTDGSCLPNPGPCGAGAVIYHPDGQEECIKRPVTAYGSILLGEFVAILSVTEHLTTNNSHIQHRQIRIFLDSQTAVILSVTEHLTTNNSRAYSHHFGTMIHTPGIGNFSA